ncbi:MAG: potassium-transporting ATPase subunit [Phycisphaerales bacterium]|nr:potassium-transporting ATPase subunit [Phycisphaerales bacterium]
MRAYVRPAIVMFVLLTVLTGVIYPAAVTAVAAVAFPREARGSLIRAEPGGRPLGSALIGQPFSDPKYFWPRPSATAPVAYNASAGSGSNLGPTNPALADAVRARVAALRAADPGNVAPVPVDLVTASASGLDPHVSPAAARFQVDRVARARRRPADEVARLVDRFTEPRTFGVLGEPRVNVLLLNLALDGRGPPAANAAETSSPVGSRWPDVAR